MLIINADDYGLNKLTTDRILTCFTEKRIHSASAMTFMVDSERAASLAKETGLPVGLHLNLDTEMTRTQLPGKLKEYHQITTAYLNTRKWNQLIYNPLLRTAFDYVFMAQWDEFNRLYGMEPARLDGHHHWHLCMNVLFSGKIPKKIKIRRNFTFQHGERNPLNRFYRRCVDWLLQTNFICTDSFYSIVPINIERLKRIIVLSDSSDVEIMTHPGTDNELTFLLNSEWNEIISQANRP